MKSNKKKLILCNDNVNSFDDVIFALMEICEYNIYQAEQCALIVHNSGTCLLKEGEKDIVGWYGRRLSDMGLKIKII